MTTTLDLKAAFFHVIDAHRWLAVSGCAWNTIGPNSSVQTKKQVDDLLPNIIVMIRDCLLLHARSLINFYRSDAGGPEDILLSDFGIPFDPLLSSALEKYKNPIGVHLLHLTDWRDFDFRSSRDTTSRGATRGRPDWNRDADGIVRLILQSLKYVSEQSGPWQMPFRDLYDAALARYQDKTFSWPPNLSDKPDVDTYLKGLRL
jgi:hypothetical protein